MYQQTIREELARIGCIGVSSRGVEAFMRLEHGCLDGLTAEQFRHEVFVSAECVKAIGNEKAEAIAESEGIR